MLCLMKASGALLNRRFQLLCFMKVTGALLNEGFRCLLKAGDSLIMASHLI